MRKIGRALKMEVEIQDVSEEVSVYLEHLNTMGYAPKGTCYKCMASKLLIAKGVIVKNEATGLYKVAPPL